MNTFLPPDTHTHTRLCGHAHGDPADYARAALSNGLHEIACTDHIPLPGDPHPGIRMNGADFETYLRLLDEARQEVPACTILRGLEADYDPVWVSQVLPDLFSRTPLDIVLGSVHHGEFWDLTADHPRATPDYIAHMWRVYFQSMEELARSRLFDVCAHFDLVKRRALRIPDRLLEEIVRPALDAVAEAGMAVELNTSGLTHNAAEIYPSAQILSWMKERDIPIVFGSDAHRPEDTGRAFPQAIALARAAGYTHYARFRARRLTLHSL